MRKKISRVVTLSALVILGSLSGKAFAQDSDLNVNDFKKALEVLLVKTSETNQQAMLATIDQSSGYVGLFPHITLGVAAALSTSSNVFGDLQSENSQDNIDFTDLDSIVGIGYAGVAYVRIGTPVFKKFPIPLDIGFYLGGTNVSSNPDNFSLVNLSSIEELKGFKIEGYILNLGFNIRHPLFYEQRFIPGLDVGLTYAYSSIKTEMVAPLGNWLGDNDLEVNQYTLEFGDSKMNLDITSYSFSTKFHTSKNFLFVEPHFGIEPYLTYASGSLIIDTGDVVVKDSSGNEVNINLDDISGLRELLGDSIKQDNTGLGINKDDLGVITSEWIGGVRLISGLSIRVWKLYGDISVSFEPINKLISGTLGGRIVY